ncbi:hypothetical protein PR202_ga19172 [Eleusine coracana subsp. coracana]|uniref:RBR-type E3 ubiquitin transferase n=1 Tax=Eleusine coracana subsp. coracana TaxID=191504 RepID=A0AAV5CVQ4_ELECO|nr:hypothetical protein PR202_ga19172 [Eleusine coracana subsp. coracana]
MAAASSAGAASTLALETHGGPFSDFSAEASSSSSSTSYTAALGPVACNSSGEEGVLDLDSPWLASVEAESRLEAAAKDTSAALVLTAEAEGEDEIRDNRQRQEDELMALEAIYGDDLAVFENKGGLRYFQVYIRYDLPDGIEVGAKLSSANATPRDVGCCDGSDEFSYTCNLEYLPPLILTCLLPRMHVKEGSVFQLVCPDTKCNTSIPPYVLKRLLTEEEFERWDRLVLQKSLDSMSDVVYCPRCVIGCLEDEDNIAQCPECTFIFCSFCKGPCHPGKQCLTPEQKIQRRQASGRMTEKEAAQELLNIRELYKDVRLCPKCGMAIAKTEGCNKMVCGSCGQYFCFRCGKAITGYEHFRDEGNCQLFAAREILEWERQMEAMDIGHRMRISSCPIGGTVRCPKCRATNFKTCGKMATILAVMVALAVTGRAASTPPKPRGQEVHLFEATVSVPDKSTVDLEECNYRLLATVLGSVEAARSVMYETELGVFSAFLTNNQARRLSKVPGVLAVKRREDPPVRDRDGHL